MTLAGMLRAEGEVIGIKKGIELSIKKGKEIGVKAGIEQNSRNSSKHGRQRL